MEYLLIYLIIGFLVVLFEIPFYTAYVIFARSINMEPIDLEYHSYFKFIGESMVKVLFWPLWLLFALPTLLFEAKRLYLSYGKFKKDNE